MHLCQCLCRLVPYRAGTNMARCSNNKGKKEIPKVIEFSTPSLTRAGKIYSPYLKWKFLLFNVLWDCIWCYRYYRIIGNCFWAVNPDFERSIFWIFFTSQNSQCVISDSLLIFWLTQHCQRFYINLFVTIITKCFGW
jgi:hypothetical protein